jgi:hypothetical protein
LPRLDIPAKVSGGAAYVQDMRLPDMLHARVIRPPRRGSQLLDIDEAALNKLPGVVKLVRNGSYLAVVATDEWLAVKAMREGYATARWTEGNPLPDSTHIHQLLTELPARRYPVSAKGQLTQPESRGYKARVTRQYLMHGSIGPSCAVAWFKEGC